MQVAECTELCNTFFRTKKNPISFNFIIKRSAKPQNYAMNSHPSAHEWNVRTAGVTEPSNFLLYAAFCASAELPQVCLCSFEDSQWNPHCGLLQWHSMLSVLVCCGARWAVSTCAVCIQCKRKRREILLRLVKTLQPLRAASVSKNPFKVSLRAFTSLNFLISVTESCKCWNLQRLS